MADLLKNLAVRELASQRTVSLFKDQEELIKQLNRKYNINIKVAKLVREGVDLALKQITEQLDK
jgi:hypothetical protein